MGFRKGMGAVRVPLHFFKFTDEGESVMNGKDQEVDTYAVHLKRRATGEVKDRTFHETLEQNSRDTLAEFCSLIVEVEGFDDFPTYTVETIGDVAFEYFNDPEVISFVDQFMLKYSRRVMPADFFRDFSASGVEIPALHEAGSKAGA